jgi:predicted  nucleic acid-binding Zn-ribbon protein
MGFNMSERVPSEVLAFAPKQMQRDKADPIDQAGQGILALVQQAANISKENADRAMSVAHRLSLQLRAAEDRIAELQAEIERAQSRAVRAEQWFEAIKGEIEVKLIAPIEANRRNPPVVQ